MLSKEEILQKAYDIQEAFTEYECSLLYKAMDEYAKQEAVEFALWLSKNQYHTNDLGEWEDFDFAIDDVFTDNEIYQLYLKSKANATK